MSIVTYDTCIYSFSKRVFSQYLDFDGIHTRVEDGGGGGNRFRPISHHAELCATEHLHGMVKVFF